MPARRKEEKKQEEDVDLSTLPPWISVFTMIEWDSSLSEVASLFPIYQFSLITRADLYNYSKEKGYIGNNVAESSTPASTLARALSEKVNSMDLQARKAKRDQMQRLDVQERGQRTESRQTSQVFTEVSVATNYPMKPDRTYILLNFPKTLEEIQVTSRYGISIQFYFYIRGESSPASSQILPHFNEAFQKSDKNSPLRTFVDKTIVYDLGKYQGMEGEVAKLEETKLEKSESVQQETEKQLRSSKTMKKVVKDVREELSTPAQPDLRKLFIAEVVKAIMETGALYVKYLVWRETVPCRPLFPSWLVHEALETTSNTTVSYNGEFTRQLGDLPSLDDAAKAWDFRVVEYLAGRADDQAATVEYFLVSAVQQLKNYQEYLDRREIEDVASETLYCGNDFLKLPYRNAGFVDGPAYVALYELYDNFNFPIMPDRSSQFISSDNANFFFDIDKNELKWMIMINRFEEIIANHTGKKTVINREYCEKLSKPVLNATIQRLLKYNPECVFTKHDGATLLGFLFDSSSVPSSSWEHSKKIRPNFRDWKEFNMYPNEFYDIDELKIGVVNSFETSLYPANGGVLKMIKYNIAQKFMKRCIGLFRDWVFGIRDNGNEAFAVLDGNKISADENFICVTVDGRVLRCGFGEVLMEISESWMRERKKVAAATEVNRVVSGKGSVVRYLEDGKLQVLFANGNVSNYDGKWVATNNRGVLSCNGVEIGKIPCASVTDPETGQRTVFRDDGTVILYYSDHTIAEFSDGTKILTTNFEYIIESPFYSPIKIDKKSLSYQIILNDSSNIVQCDDFITLSFNNNQESVKYKKTSLIISDFVMNFATSSITCNDELGNVFSIGLNQEPKQQINHKIEVFSNIPRLFIINEIGDGIEILSENQIQNFISPSYKKLICKDESRNYEIFHRPVNKQAIDKGHIEGTNLTNYTYSKVFQMIKPSPEYLKSDKTEQVSFRYFEKFSKFTEEKRKNFKEKYLEYADWQNKQNNGKEFGMSQFSKVSFEIQRKSILARIQQLKNCNKNKKDIKELVEQQVLEANFPKSRIDLIPDPDSAHIKICDSPVQKRKSARSTIESVSINSTMHSFNYFKSPEGLDASFTSQSYVKSPEILKLPSKSQINTVIPSINTIGKASNDSFEDNPFVSLHSKLGKKVVLKPVFNPSVYSQVEKLQKLRESSEKAIADEYHMSKNMNFDLVGGLRKSLPHVSALRSTSPASSKVNFKYVNADLATETKVRTISQTRRSIFKQPNSITHRRESNPNVSKSLFIQEYLSDPLRRLLEITPSSIHFGNILLGQVTSSKLIVKNEESTLIRFMVRQPNIKEAKVIYRPGPIAPGMITKFIVEFTAKELGNISGEFEVLCKSEIYTIPINASVVNDEALVTTKSLTDKIRERKLPALNRSMA